MIKPFPPLDAKILHKQCQPVATAQHSETMAAIRLHAAINLALVVIGYRGQTFETGLHMIVSYFLIIIPYRNTNTVVDHINKYC